MITRRPLGTPSTTAPLPMPGGQRHERTVPRAKAPRWADHSTDQLAVRYCHLLEIPGCLGANRRATIVAWRASMFHVLRSDPRRGPSMAAVISSNFFRSEEHTSELQSLRH